MAPFATFEDVAVLWQPLTDEQSDTADMLLAVASAIIRGVVTDVDDRVTAGTLDVTIPQYVAAAMVLRVMRNPDGMKSESIDDYRYERDDALSAGALRLSGDELAVLRGRRSGAFSIRPGAEPVTYAILDQVAKFRALRECA